MQTFKSAYSSSRQYFERSFIYIRRYVIQNFVAEIYFILRCFHHILTDRQTFRTENVISRVVQKANSTSRCRNFDRARRASIRARDTVWSLSHSPHQNWKPKIMSALSTKQKCEHVRTRQFKFFQCLPALYEKSVRRMFFLKTKFSQNNRFLIDFVCRIKKIILKLFSTCIRCSVFDRIARGKPYNKIQLSLIRLQ